MKTSMNNQRHQSHVLKCLLPIVAAGALASCGSHSVAITQSEMTVAPASTPVRIWHQEPSESSPGLEDEVSTHGWRGMWNNPIEFRDSEDLVPLIEFSVPL